MSEAVLGSNSQNLMGPVKCAHMVSQEIRAILQKCTEHRMTQKGTFMFFDVCVYMYVFIRSYRAQNGQLHFFNHTVATSFMPSACLSALGKRSG